MDNLISSQATGVLYQTVVEGEAFFGHLERRASQSARFNLSQCVFKLLQLFAKFLVRRVFAGFLFVSKF
ncbi:hypothetical protein Pan241w_49870 [Gimesia alba]|uniref:Uncharacterized protein n=1 Tax=Gimesia alba TaxID=2527973 RepID=A0A517RLV6_9PLAN|nr:hypothetical protein Pan241w_49870 [Gimesia alba]